MKASHFTHLILSLHFPAFAISNRSRKFRQFYLTILICFAYLSFFAFVCVCRGDDPTQKTDSVPSNITQTHPEQVRQSAPVANDKPGSTATAVPAQSSPQTKPVQPPKDKTGSSKQGIAHSGTTPATANEQAGLGIDDIKQFQAKTSTVGESSEQLKAKAKDASPSKNKDPGKRFQEQASVSLENYCESTETALVACFDSFWPYFRLFENYPPTIQWTGRLKELFQNIFATLERSPVECRKLLHDLQQHLGALENFKSQLIKASHETDSSKDHSDQPLFVSRYNLNNKLEIIDGLRRSVERRIYFWALAANYYELKTKGKLVAPRDLTIDDLQLLRRRTEDVRNYFGVTVTGQAWRTGFEIDLLIGDLEHIIQTMSGKQQFKPVSTAGTGTLDKNQSLKQQIEQEKRHIRDRINSICYKVFTTPMSEAQKQVFAREPLAPWIEMLDKFYCDQADADDLLWAFEQYERSSGADSGRILLQTAYQMKSSASEVAQAFGEGVDIIFDNPNTKVYISEMLINRLLPIRDPEFDVVQETILNNPVAGRRRTDTQIFIDLVPSPDRLLMNLHVEGKIVAATSSDVFPAKVFNESYASYLGEKQIEWKNNGIAYAPALVAVDNSNQLSGVQTEVDFVPLIGDLVREVAKGQYELKQSEIERETRRRIEIQAKNRIDQEANERFDIVNSRLHRNFFRRLNELGLSLIMQNSKTTSDWLLASLRLGTGLSLGSQSTEPPTLPGAFADLKIHESSINIFLSQLNLEGKTFDSRELVNHIVSRLELRNQPKIETGNANLSLSFAQSDPVILKFFEDRVYLELAFESISLNNRTWNDIVVSVSYRPETNIYGQTMLYRDGMVGLEGPLGIRAQVPLRAIFSKVFPVEKRFALEPPIFKKDERFTNLSIGQCRISRGWFALAIVRNR